MEDGKYTNPHGTFGLYLEPETSTLKWLFQLDDSKSLHEKWLFHQTSIKKLLFGVPGTTYGGKHFSELQEKTTA